jgi:hypothetical protein
MARAGMANTPLKMSGTCGEKAKTHMITDRETVVLVGDQS